MVNTTRTSMAENLLRILGANGEMRAQEFLKNVPRTRGDYLDFYPVAALLHANYIGTDSDGVTGAKPFGDKLGGNTQDTAVCLCQLMLPPGESFQINKCPRDSWHDFPVKVFMKVDGYLRLDELEQRRLERRRKRTDYIVSFSVAVLVAVLSSYLAHYFATKRLQLERSEQASPAGSPLSGPPAQSQENSTPQPSKPKI